MSLRKTLSVIFAVVVSFVAVSAVSAESADEIVQKFKLSDNCPEAIKRFPENLRSGMQAVYLSYTGYMGKSEKDALSLLDMFLGCNYIKTNVILPGKGSERVKDTNTTYSQQYTQLRVSLLQTAAMLQMAVVTFGNLTKANSDIWGNLLTEWL